MEERARRGQERRVGSHHAAILAALVVLLASCGGDNASDAAGPPDGGSLYATNCALCHGTDLRGTSMGPSHLSVVYERGHHPDESFRQAVENGVSAHHFAFGNMPPVRGLSAAEIDAIIAYVRDVQDREGFEP